MKLKIFTTGGTIDKDYFDQKSQYHVGVPKVEEILAEANVAFEHECEMLMQKDSLDLTDADRRLIHDRVRADPHTRLLITHGTDTVIQTALALLDIPDKVIVLTGAMQPALFKASDAEFNVGFAAAAAQTLPPGVYIAINGRVFDPRRARKNVERNRFEEVPHD